jgi:hypothetical protein
MFSKINKDNPVICWWSGGITSAVACYICIMLFGIENCRIIFIDTKNEDPDTYRFKKDCEKWYGKEIETITNEKYNNIEEVWDKYQSLNVAHGAICSTELKREVRLKFQKENSYAFQSHGFDIGEPKRALAMTLNYSDSNPFYPLLFMGWTKKYCFVILKQAGIEPPNAYKLGYKNNNCLKTKCVQGGIGYWQMVKREDYPAFLKMAQREHKYTDAKGFPVTMLKDQSKGGGLVFLLPHPDYPNVKDISMMKGREPEPMIECNGHCGINDLIQNSFEKTEERGQKIK